MSETEFITRFGRKNRVSQVNTGPSKTQQQFKAECDVNNIIKRYHKDPQLWSELINKVQDPSSPEFQDFTNIGDFQSAMEKVSQIGEFFQSIPSEVRRKYNQDPAALFKAMQNPDNWIELANSGVLSKTEVKKYFDARARIIQNGKKIVRTQETASPSETK